MLTDEMLRQAAGESCSAFVQTLERDYCEARQYTPSPKFEKQIKKLMRKANHPYLYQVAQRVAAVALVVLLAGSAWLTVDVQARETFFGWVKEWYGTYFVYRFEASANSDTSSVEYQLTIIPEGYTEFYSDFTEGTASVVYANEDGNLLKFSYSYNPDKIDWFVEVATMTQTQVTVGSTVADLFVASDEAIGNALMWISDDNTAFFISGFLDETELIQIAENISIK